MGINLTKHVHGGHRGHRAGVGLQGGECGGGARLLDIGVRQTGGEGRRRGERLDTGEDVGAVNHLAGVLSEDSELSHGGLEARNHEVLLVDEALPEASSARVAGESEIGLEAHLAGISTTAEGKRRRDLAGVVVQTGESLALEQNLKEHLRIESEGGLGEAYV